MATKPDDDEPLELTDVVEPGDEPEEQPEPGENPDDEGEEQPTVSFEGEEPEPESDNSAIRQMRTAMREKDRRIAELEKASAPKSIDVGEEPTLAGCDYDEDKFKADWKAWNDNAAAAEAQTRQAAEANREAQESWAAAKQRYDAKVAEYGFSDIKADEALVEGALGINSPVILKAVRDPAAMIRALGSHPAKLAELAKLKDPFELAGELARMEGAVKVTRKAPPPDRAQRGSAAMPVTGGPDKELARLEKEAERNGNDRSKVIAYKSELKAKAEAK